MAFDNLSGTVVLYGGNSAAGGILEDMWMWNGIKWREVKMNGESPGKRFLHAMTFDKDLGKIILGGGKRTNNIWRYMGMEWCELEKNY
jgi:hypothetical protein